MNDNRKPGGGSGAPPRPQPKPGDFGKRDNGQKSDNTISRDRPAPPEKPKK